MADKETPAEEKLSTKEDAVGTGLGIEENAKGAEGASELETKLQEKEAMIRELKVSIQILSCVVLACGGKS